MKKWMLLIAAAVLLSGCVQYKDGKPVDEPAKKEAEPAAVEKESDPSEWDDMKDQDKIIGKSDKDFKKLTKSKPGKVLNDKTGKWKKTRLSENANIEEYLLSYHDLYMKDDEIHYIINFVNNTTTVVRKMNGLITAEVHERVEKEEHDAATIGSGMLLKSYTIYPDGDIEETE